MLTQGRASLEGNQYIIMCSVWAAMAQNQADWELDKVENRMVKAGQADRGCTLAGKGVEALATSWVSEPFLMKLPCPGMSSDRQVVVCGGGGRGLALWLLPVEDSLLHLRRAGLWGSLQASTLSLSNPPHMGARSPDDLPKV